MRIAISRLGLFAVAAAAVTAAPPIGTAAEAPAAPPAPREGCVTYTDAKGDAGYVGTPNDPDLDITGVVLASPPGQLRAYVSVAKLDATQFAAGHQFLVSFTLDSKPIEFYAGESDAPEVRSAAETARVAPLTGVRYNGVAVAGAKVDVVYDAKTSTVVMTTDRAAIETAGKISLADGVVLSAATARTLADYVYTTIGADTATGKDAESSKYTIGDNTCFAPPEGRLALTLPAAVVTGHSAVVSGTLTNAAGAAVGGKNVTLSLAGKTARVTSGADGTFSATFAVTSNAGSYPVTATWAGDDTLQAATATAPLTVKIQPTSTTLTSAVSGTAVVVKATLLNDLRKPVAGQTVTWLVDGRAAGSSRTDAAGRATLRTAKGKTVKATFAGVSGRYAGSTASRRT